MGIGAGVPLNFWQIGAKAAYTNDKKEHKVSARD